MADQEGQRSSVPVLGAPAPMHVPNLGATPPMLRPALGGGRAAPRTGPRLGLAIPPPGVPSTSPAPAAMMPALAPPAGRPKLPSLNLPTAGKPLTADQAPPRQGPPRLAIGVQPGPASIGSESSAAHSRSGSIGPFEGRASNPASAGSQLSALSFASTYGIGVGKDGLGNAALPADVAGEMVIPGLEGFDALTIDKACTKDVEELDEDGWRITSLKKRIIELGGLGEGAGGAVTKCMLKGGRTIFALKVITSNPDPDVKKQIVRELGFNRSCASEHICTYYGAFVDPATATISIAMEFCEGGCLDGIYKEIKRLGGRTGEKVLGKVAEGMLSGLTYLNKRRIIHRDIKPSNVLLTRKGQVKLCDFGVSGDFGTKGEADTFIGTSYYMAPERITGQSYTITSDVWSTGVTLLEVAQHRFPFPADGTEMQPRAGLIDLLTYIVRQPTPKLKDEPDANIFWSDKFKYFIESCLEKDPVRRASPWRMLEHPWMEDMKTKRVNIEKYLAQVWGWQ